MLVIIKKGRRIRRVENVSFQDAHKPMVNGSALCDIQQNEGDPDAFQFLESVLWFKTYMVAAIYIDCDRRDIMWYRCEIQPFNLHTDMLLERHPPDGQRLFEDIDVYDYDPVVDELIDQANRIMDLFNSGNINHTNFLCEVVRIIHCYILPSLRFSVLDIPNLNKAAERIRNLLQMTEKEIVSKGKAVDLSATNLEKQRRRLLRSENLHVESHVRCCNRDFLSYFLLHIEKEILSIDSQLMQFQMQINQKHDGDPDSPELKTLRQNRDRALYHLEKLQTVRESIKNVTQRSHKSKKSIKNVKIKQNVFHDIYKELSIRLLEQKEELHKLVLKKLKVTTVREAIRNSLKELEKGGQSPNSPLPRTSFTDGSEYSLDVLGTTLRPESWMTIDDKIRNELYTYNSAINIKHQQNVDLLIEKTNAALSEMDQFGIRIEFGDDLSGNSRISSLMPDDTSLSLSVSSFDGDSLDKRSSLLSHKEIEMNFIQEVGDSARNRRSVRPLSQSVCDQLTDLSTSSLKRSMGDIGQDFHACIENMCELFLATIPEVEQRHFNKLWISYESILCDKVIEKISELYIAVYKKPCHTLYKSLVKLSLSDFIIDDKFFKMLMHQSFEDLMDLDESSPSSSEASLGRSNSDADTSTTHSSVCSLEINKCTLEELYSMADQECENVPQDIPNLLDPHIFDGPSRSRSLDSVATLKDEIGSTFRQTGSHSSKSVEQCYKEALEKLLSPAVLMIKDAIAAKSLLEKLRFLTKSFRFMNNQLVKMNEGENSACCDDMLTITTALIIDLDCDLFTQLYANINLLMDLKAEFLSGGVHDYCLINFYSAFNYLFDKQVLERRELATTSNC